MNTPKQPTPANATSEWLKLCDYGDHPHAKGLQRLTPDAARAIVRHHRSLYGRLKRYFGGVPVFIGHPDDPHFAGTAGHTDTRAYAWIHALEARSDGLYVLPTWGAKGQELLQNAHYKHLSPRWKLRANEDGSWTPVELLSVGLTNMPNILGPTIANENRAAVSDAAEADELIAELEENQKRSADEFAPRPSSYKLGLPMVARSLGLEATASAEVVAEKIKTLHDSTAAAAEKLALINAQLDLALERGQIALAERPEWSERLAASDCAANELSAMPRLQRAACKPFLSDTLTPYQQHRASARADFVRAVEERMSNTGEDFPTAWAAIKESRREIFQKLSNN